MATYNWANLGDGDFDDPHNWLNSKTNKDGVPGKGDTASFIGFTSPILVTCQGETIAVLNAQGPIEFTGDLTVTRSILDGGFENGTLNVGAADLSSFSNETVIAQTLLGCVFDGGTASTVNLSGGMLEGGATVVASGVVSGGLVERGSLTGSRVVLSHSVSFSVSGASADATIDGAASVGDLADIFCGGSNVDDSIGGKLTFKQGLTIGQGRLTDYNGGAIETTSLGVDPTDPNTPQPSVYLWGGSKLTVSGLFVFNAVGLTNQSAATVGDDAVMSVGECLLASVAGKSAQLAIGDEDMSTGAATFRATQGWVIGGAGSATVDLYGKSVSSSEGGVILGKYKTGVGAIYEYGEDDHLSFGTSMIVGDAGNGTVNLVNGGLVRALSGKGSDGELELGLAEGGSGSMTLRGGAVEVASLSVGVAGAGAFDDYTSVGASDARELLIGVSATGVGSAILWGAEFTAASEVVIGEGGKGSLTIENGAHLDSVTDKTPALAVLGANAKSSGTLTIEGSASAAYFGGLTVGENGRGVVSLTSGGLLFVDSVGAAKGVLDIGADKGASGRLSLSGGAGVFAAELYAGGETAAAGGSAIVSVGAGSQAGFDKATIWKRATVTVAGSLSIAEGIAGNGTIEIESGGTFSLPSVKDTSVGITFEKGTKETLNVVDALLPTVKLQGFASGDSIDILGLAAGSKIETTYSGSTAVVTFLDGSTNEGRLAFAEAAGHHDVFAFDAAKDVLTLASGP